MVFTSCDIPTAGAISGDQLVRFLWHGSRLVLLFTVRRSASCLARPIPHTVRERNSGGIDLGVTVHEIRCRNIMVLHVPISAHTSFRHSQGGTGSAGVTPSIPVAPLAALSLSRKPRKCPLGES